MDTSRFSGQEIRPVVHDGKYLGYVATNGNGSYAAVTADGGRIAADGQYNPRGFFFASEAAARRALTLACGH